jgi:hypothetical protein
MDFIEFDDTQEYLLKRVPGDMCTASARTIEILNDNEELRRPAGTASVSESNGPRARDDPATQNTATPGRLQPAAGSAQGGEWFEDDPPADSRFKHEPLEGPLKSLARWMGMDQRTLAKHNGQAGWWIRKIHGRKYAAWFSTEHKYAEANRKRVVETAPDSTK